MHPYFSYPRDSLGAECPEFESVNAAGCRRVPRFAVGARLSADGVTPDEVQRHIDDLTAHFLSAYARYERHRVPADREEALMWLHQRDQAILERAQVARERRSAFGAQAAQSEDGAGFFASDAALDLWRGFGLV